MDVFAKEGLRVHLKAGAEHASLVSDLALERAATPLRKLQQGRANHPYAVRLWHHAHLELAATHRPVATLRPDR